MEAGQTRVGTVRKITKTKDGVLVGAAGRLSSISAFLAWWEDQDEDKPPLHLLNLEEYNGIVVLPDKTVLLYEDTGYPMEVKAPFYVGGSGGDVALGALEMGATPEQAVKAAIKHCPGCGGKVQVVKL